MSLTLAELISHNLRQALPTASLARRSESYVLRSNPVHGKRLGLMAQDVETIYPEVVQGQGDDKKL